MPTLTGRRFRPGDRVTIVDNIGSHVFSTGTVVTLIPSDSSGEQVWCGNSLRSGNYLYENECELYERPEISDDEEYECIGCCDQFRYADIDQDTWLCPSCTEEETYKNIIHDYSWKPKTYVFDKMPHENTMYLGIELEIECGDEDTTLIARKVMKWLEEHKVQDRVYLKDDGSLDNGFEIVFMPSTLEAIEARFPMKEFLTYLRRIGCSAEDTCGLHVHLSKTKMSERSLWEGKMFFFKCQEQILEFSRRSDTDYCKFDDSIPMDGKKQDHGRYSAFNLYGSTNTVEIRVFAGTLDYAELQASLQFSDLFGEYIQKKPVAWLKEKAGSEIWADFIRFAGKGKKHKALVAYCKNRGIV